MLYAYNKLNIKIRAYKHGEGWCPACNQKLIPKCGAININHWAHNNKCEISWNHETEWHLIWKELAELNGCEIESYFGDRIADAVLKENVYEFQHSSISVEEIVGRSEYYYNNKYIINWIFDVSTKYERGNIEFKYKPSFKRYYINTHWVSKSLPVLFEPWHTQYGIFTKPRYGNVYLDIGYQKPIFRLYGLYGNGNGSGIFIPRNGIFQAMYNIFDCDDLDDDINPINRSLYCEIL